MFDFKGQTNQMLSLLFIIIIIIYLTVITQPTRLIWIEAELSLGLAKFLSLNVETEPETFISQGLDVKMDIDKLTDDQQVASWLLNIKFIQLSPSQ